MVGEPGEPGGWVKECSFLAIQGVRVRLTFWILSYSCFQELAAGQSKQDQPVCLYLRQKIPHGRWCWYSNGRNFLQSTNGWFSHFSEFLGVWKWWLKHFPSVRWSHEIQLSLPMKLHSNGLKGIPFPPKSLGAECLKQVISEVERLVEQAVHLAGCFDSLVSLSRIYYVYGKEPNNG